MTPTQAYRPRQHRTTPDEPAKSQVEFEFAEEPWTVTLGFVSHGDELVLADVRIFPTRDTPDDRSLNPNDRKRKWGEWSWDPELVPPGGLTMRTIRKLSIGGAVSTAVANVPRPDGYLGDAGFVTAHHARVRSKPDEHVRRRKPELLARVALLYERARAEGRAPNKLIYAELATVWPVAESTVPGLVRAARAAGYLTPAIKGRASGSATAAAHALANGGR